MAMSFGCVDCGQAQCVCAAEVRQQRLGGVRLTIKTDDGDDHLNDLVCEIQPSETPEINLKPRR